jgi:sugar lactone lactonase YvrE
MTNHRPPNIGQSITQDIAQGSTNASPESTLGHADGLGHTGTTAHPTEPMGLKRRHFMGTALALDAAALLAACGGGGGDSGSTNTSGSSSGSGSASSSASGSASSSASGSGSGSASPTNWVVTTWAGATPQGLVFVDGTAATATFGNLTGIALDSTGNVYVAALYEHRIRKITSAGVVSTVAGVLLTSGYVDGTGATAKFFNPYGVAVDTSGHVYVADKDNHLIRKISSAGVVSTLAGVGGVAGNVDGTGGTAKFRYPEGIAVDSRGTVYVGDTGNHLIRTISPTGVVSTLAGTTGVSGAVNGTGLTAQFNKPTLLALDTSGNLLVADQINQLIRKITPLGVVSTLAGVAETFGYADGTATTAKFYNPYGIAVDAGGNVYVTENNNHLIRKITPSGVVSTVAGAALSAAYVDGTGTAARFNNPDGVAVDTSGHLYLADHNNSRIRKITPIF